jgi:hypothetical protein
MELRWGYTIIPIGNPSGISIVLGWIPTFLSGTNRDITVMARLYGSALLALLNPWRATFAFCGNSSGINIGAMSVLVNVHGTTTVIGTYPFTIGGQSAQALVLDPSASVAHPQYINTDPIACPLNALHDYTIMLYMVDDYTGPPFNNLNASVRWGATSPITGDIASTVLSGNHTADSSVLADVYFTADNQSAFVTNVKTA